MCHARQPTHSLMHEHRGALPTPSPSDVHLSSMCYPRMRKSPGAIWGELFDEPGADEAVGWCAWDR